MSAHPPDDEIPGDRRADDRSDPDHYADDPDGDLAHDNAPDHDRADDDCSYGDGVEPVLDSDVDRVDDGRGGGSLM
jgi:hypothetical protein